MAELFGDRYTVAEKIDYLTAELRERRCLRLGDLFRAMRHRYEMVCTFLALLELIRLRQIRAQQAGPFGEIEIVPAEES